VRSEDGPVIVIDVGHDASTGGALGAEYVDTLRTALVTRDALDAAGYAVYLTRADDGTKMYGNPDLMPDNADSMDVSYNEGYAHASAALQYGPDLVLSIHYNAADDPDVAGATVYYCDNGGPQNATLAALMRDELASAFAELGYEPPYVDATEDSAIGNTYGELATLGNVYNAPFDYAGNRLDGIPAVLTETLFETNPTERALIEDDMTLDAIAQAYVRAIDAYFGR
jgi:N-acetylmuramoyl-L-alanine amidase